VVKELLKHNADIEAKDKDGKTALNWGILLNSFSPEFVFY
jgi:hypothetical protein